MDAEVVKLFSAAVEAPLRKEAWHEFLDGLADRYGAVQAVITTTDPDHAMRQVTVMSPTAEARAREMLEMYLAGEDKDDVEGMKKLVELPLGCLRTEAEIVGAASVEDLPPNAFRSFVRERYGIHHRAALPLLKAVNQVDVLWGHFPRERDPGEPELRAQLELFAPIVATSLRTHRVFEALRARFRAALGAIDRLGIGAILMLGDGSIVVANEVAQRILTEGDGIGRDSGGRLRLASGSLAPEVTRLVDEAWRTARGEAWSPGAALTVARPSGRPDYLVTIGPVIDAEGEIERGLGCAMAFIADPGGATPVSVEGLRALGGLTEAETAICELLVNGATTQDIAKRRGVAPDTVRKQCKAVLGKLKCSSRTDLLRVALHSRLPIL